MQNNANTGKVTLNDRINDFVQKNRTVVFGCIGFMVIALAGFLISLAVIDSIRNRDISAVEELNTRYEALKSDITENGTDVQTLITDLETFAKKTKGYSGGRAWSILANICRERDDWDAAEKAWVNAAITAGKTYLAPVAWFNAGACAEKLERNDAALEYYTKAAAKPDAFPAAAQAQFFIGRLKEDKGDIDGAMEAYRLLISGWPNDTIWPNFAHSRIVWLEAQAK